MSIIVDLNNITINNETSASNQNHKKIKMIIVKN